jgi:hypothetical protein|tara:strand:- start:919 stop:1260 length:342 start_codon:yes stop_codon:yes gene_type:complete
MASYKDIDAKSTDEEMLSKIRTALKVNAEDIATKTVRFADEKDNEKYPTVAEKTWARAVLYNANNEAIKAFNFILARNKDLEDLSVLNSYTNDEIQSEVNRVTRYLVLAQAGQ